MLKPHVPAGFTEAQTDDTPPFCLAWQFWACYLLWQCWRHKRQKKSRGFKLYWFEAPFRHEKHILPTSWSVCASLDKSSLREDNTHHHGDTHNMTQHIQLGQLTCIMQPWNMMGAAAHLQNCSVETTVCVCVTYPQGPAVSLSPGVVLPY